MPDPSGTLETIARALARLVQPLEERLIAGDLRLLLTELGLQFPTSIEADAGLRSSASAAVQRLRDVPALLAALDQARAANDTVQLVAKSLELANTVRVFGDASNAFAMALRAAGGGGGIPPAELNQFADELPGRLLEYVSVRNLEGLPGASEALEFIGSVERIDVPGVDAAHPAFIRRRLHVDQLTGFVQDPAANLRARYQWGDPAFDGLAMLRTVQRLFARAGVPAIVDTSGPAPVLDALFLEVKPKLDVDPRGLVIKIIHPFEVGGTQDFAQDDWLVRLLAETALGVGSQIIVQPNDGVTLIPTSTANPVEGDLTVEWVGGSSAGTPYTILGEPGSSRLEAKQFIVRTGAGFAWNGTANRAEGTFKVGGEMKGGKLAVSLANADGFIGKILGGFAMETDFDVGLGLSSREGLFFTGSATLDIQLPLHVQLGPVEINALTLTVGFGSDTFPIGLRTNIKAGFGPLVGLVEQIGIGADISLPANRQGNAGPVDFKLKFLPPKGVGLSIDAGVVKGGGYLFIDVDRGEYAGTLELDLAGIVTAKAVGIITTKMPDGSKGFSLLIIISAEFGTGIQLGFGFTLLAVGGLVGLNRTMNMQALMDGVRTGAINSVMFPQDVIANAPKIISDLRTLFPPREGTFLIGPMAKIGWGTPTLISLSLGVIIEIPPGNIAILGVLKVALPAADAPLIVLQVNFAGAIEFDKKRLYFFASLFESRVIFINLDGEMGLLVAFGDDANFVVSVGGFHPRFSPPPLPFPSPRRIALDLLNSPIARVRIEGYFAVTSNTVQFGARVEVFFGLDILNVSGHLAFDALFQFSPFKFIIEISASFSVKVFGAGLFSVGVSGMLEGPGPYHIRGHGSISILFWDIDVDFETSWGENENTELPPISVMPLIEAELNKTDNWRAVLPASNGLLVSLRKMPAEEAALILHPLGFLKISQRKLPLELKLDKVGNQKPSDVNRLSLALTGGGLAKKDDAFELFAPAQFQNFSDADKLSRPAFAAERSGLNLAAGGSNTRSSNMVKRVVRYEEIIIDNNYKRFERRFRIYFGVFFEFFLHGNAAARCELSQASKAKVIPFKDKIAVKDDGYVVAFQSNNQAFTGSTAFHSEASARDFMNGKLAEDPNLAATLHVIPAFEIAA